jgi:hypothetical protein
MHYGGMTIVPSPLAIRRTDRFSVERTAIRKRRKGWRVVKTTTDDPAMIVVGSTVYVHPLAYAKLKESIK